MPEKGLQNESEVTRGASSFGQRREDIFKRLQQSAEQCKLNYEGRKLATESDDVVADLCESLEDCFSYGLRQQNVNVILSAASLFQNMHEIVIGGGSSSNNNDITFWDFCQAHLTAHERERFNKLKQIWTKVGRGRAFIRSALNENSLHRYVLTWLNAEDILNQYYTPWSLLLNDEVVKKLPEILDNLKDVLFALNVDSTELNVPCRKTNLPVGVAKDEPIIYAPEPVPVADVKPKRKVSPVERPIVNASSTEDLLSTLNPLEIVEVQQIEVNKIIDEQSIIESKDSEYNTPVDPIEPELEFLKTPLPETFVNEQQIGCPDVPTNIADQENYEDRSDTSSQYSKSSSSAALEEQVRLLNERCALLETRVAELSLQNRQLVRRLTTQFNESGINPSSSLCSNFLITIPQVKLVKPQLGSPYYTYEVHITMRQRLEHWSLFRRYRDFYKLHKSLLRTHPAVTVVEFPPKKHFGNMNLVFVEERRQQLQIYLLNLVEMLPQVEACKSKADLQQVFPFFRAR